LEKAAFTIYLVTLILSPLLFGSVHTYAYTLMAIGVLTGTLLLVIKNVKKDLKTGTYHFQLPNTSLNFFFLIMTGFLIIQVIPLPDSIIQVLSPETWVVQQKSIPASSIVVQQSQSNIWGSLSPYYYPVRMSIIRFTVYGLFFFGLIQVLNSQKRIELTISLILITGCFEALYGLMQTFSGAEHIWWFKKRAYLGDVTGTYVNRNHFAGLMEMGLLLAACYSAALSLRRKKRRTIQTHKPTLRARLSQYLSGEQRFNKRTLILFAGVVMGIGLVFSASRGGLIATAGAMLCMSLLFIFRSGHRRYGFVLLILFLVTAVYALHIGVEYPLGRFKYFDSTFEARSRYAKKTIEMFEDYKLAGVGAGNFRYAYPKYQAAEDKKIFLRYAHNDWAQFLAEAGITGFCLLLAGMSYYVYCTVRLWKKRKDPFAVCLGVAPLGVITTLGIHSYSDFNLHLPANFLMLVGIMAIGYSALHLERHRGRDRTICRYYDIPLKYKGFLSLVLVSGFIVWAGIWTVRHFIAECYCNTVHNYSLNRDPNPPLEEIKKAVEWDRKNPVYWYKLALELIRIRNAEMGMWNNEKKLERQLEIVRALEKAVLLNPLEPEYHIRLGWGYVYLWNAPDYHEKWLPTADISMDRATYFAGDNNPFLHVMMGNYWVMRSKTISPDRPAWKTCWAKACWHYKKNLSLESGRDRKRMIKEIRRNIWLRYPDETFVKQAIE